MMKIIFCSGKAPDDGSDARTAKNNRMSLRAKNGGFVIVKLHTVPFRDVRGFIQDAIEAFEGSLPKVTNRRTKKLAAFGYLDNGTGLLNQGMIEGHLRGHLELQAKSRSLLHPVHFGRRSSHIRERFGLAAVDANSRRNHSEGNSPDRFRVQSQRIGTPMRTRSQNRSMTAFRKRPRRPRKNEAQIPEKSTLTALDSGR